MVQKSLPEVVGASYDPDITHVAVNDGGKWIPGFLHAGRFFPRVAGGAEGGGSGGGGESGGTGTGDDGNDGDEEEESESDDEGEDKEGAEKGDKGKSKPPAKKTYTLTEDRLKSRLQRESASTLRALAKELGYDSVEAMKAATKTAKESSDAEKRDLPKAESRIKELEAENRRLSAGLRENSLRIAVEREASRMGFVDPEDAFRLGDFADNDGSDYLGSDDKVDSEAIRESLEELAERKKHLIKSSVRRKKRGEADEDEDEDEEDEEEDVRARTRASTRGREGGGPPGRNGSGAARKAANEEALKKRFPLAFGQVRPRV